MKKLFSVILAVAALSLILASCGGKDEKDAEETTKEQETTAALTMPESTAAPETAAPEQQTTALTTEAGEIGSGEAVEVARAYLGEKDEDSGYKYAYSFDSKMSDNGKDYYKIRVSWYLEEEDRYSLCGYLLVTLDGKSVTKFGW